jgi:hypothetical protein
MEGFSNFVTKNSIQELKKKNRQKEVRWYLPNQVSKVVWFSESLFNSLSFIKRVSQKEMIRENILEENYVGA